MRLLNVLLTIIGLLGGNSAWGYNDGDEMLPVTLRFPERVPYFHRERIRALQYHILPGQKENTADVHISNRGQQDLELEFNILGYHDPEKREKVIVPAGKEVRVGTELKKRDFRLSMARLMVENICIVSTPAPVAVPPLPVLPERADLELTPQEQQALEKQLNYSLQTVGSDVVELEVHNASPMAIHFNPFLGGYVPRPELVRMHLEPGMRQKQRFQADRMDSRLSMARLRASTLRFGPDEGIPADDRIRWEDTRDLLTARVEPLDNHTAKLTFTNDTTWTAFFDFKLPGLQDEQTPINPRITVAPGKSLSLEVRIERPVPLATQISLVNVRFDMDKGSFIEMRKTSESGEVVAFADQLDACVIVLGADRGEVRFHNYSMQTASFDFMVRERQSYATHNPRIRIEPGQTCRVPVKWDEPAKRFHGWMCRQDAEQAGSERVLIHRVSLSTDMERDGGYAMPDQLDGLIPEADAAQLYFRMSYELILNTDGKSGELRFANSGACDWEFSYWIANLQKRRDLANSRATVHAGEKLSVPVRLDQTTPASAIEKVFLYDLRKISK